MAPEMLYVRELKWIGLCTCGVLCHALPFGLQREESVPLCVGIANMYIAQVACSFVGRDNLQGEISFDKWTLCKILSPI